MGWGSRQSLTGLLAPSGHSHARLYRRGALLSLRYDHARSMRNALAGNLSPSLTACNTDPLMTKHSMTNRCCIASRVLLPGAHLEPDLSMTAWLLATDHRSGWSDPWLPCRLICRWPLGYWSPITSPDDLRSAPWSLCHPVNVSPYEWPTWLSYADVTNYRWPTGSSITRMGDLLGSPRVALLFVFLFFVLFFFFFLA